MINPSAYQVLRDGCKHPNRPMETPIKPEPVKAKTKSQKMEDLLQWQETKSIDKVIAAIGVECTRKMAVSALEKNDGDVTNAVIWLTEKSGAKSEPKKSKYHPIGAKTAYLRGWESRWNEEYQCWFWHNPVSGEAEAVCYYEEKQQYDANSVISAIGIECTRTMAISALEKNDGNVMNAVSWIRCELFHRLYQ